MAVTLSEAIAPLTPGSKVPVEWRGLTFNATVRRSKRARRAKLRILDGELEVVLPVKAPIRAATDLLSLHEDWAYRFLQKSARPRPKSLSFQGSPLGIQRVDGLSCAQLTSNVLFIPGEWTMSDLQRWARAESARIYREVIERRSREMGLVPKQVQFRDQRSKWGACSSTGTVTFNWRVIMAPPEVLDYLVVHELAHLKELNHSDRFWAIVEQHCPDHRRLRRWLKQNGYALQWPDTIPTT